MCGAFITDKTTGQRVRWTEYRKTMSWMEWFIPQCPTCFGLRIMLAWGIFFIARQFGLSLWLAPVILAAAYTFFSAIGNAQPRNWFACMGERKKTKEP